jgi:hypothetical protein
MLMTHPSDPHTLVYPLLGAERDLGFARLSGHGLGNSFYSYFHAAVLAARGGASCIMPAWFSLKLGPLLRGESSKRFYFRMFSPYPGEIHGLGKLLKLSTRRKHYVDITRSADPRLADGKLNLVRSMEFTFRGLHEHRPLIRDRLLRIVNDPIPAGHAWGRSGYVAVHVRLGDFAVLQDPKELLSGKANARIPLSWYVAVVSSLRQRLPDRKILIFSDGKESELQPLLCLGASVYRSGSDITDLLAMAGADLLVGSNSTFSRWAAFLGDMPSVWIKKSIEEEKPSAAATELYYVPIDAQQVPLWN